MRNVHVLRESPKGSWWEWDKVLQVRESYSCGTRCTKSTHQNSSKKGASQ